MSTKKLLNKLSAVARSLAEDDFVNCDILICSEHVFLKNWRNGMITTVALHHLCEVCASYDLQLYVDFDFQKVTIYG